MVVNTKYCPGVKHSSGQSITRNQGASEIIWVSTCNGETEKCQEFWVLETAYNVSATLGVAPKLVCLKSKIQL